VGSYAVFVHDNEGAVEHVDVPLFDKIMDDRSFSGIGRGGGRPLSPRLVIAQKPDAPALALDQRLFHGQNVASLRWLCLPELLQLFFQVAQESFILLVEKFP
jgi:hypothetical protein